MRPLSQAPLDESRTDDSRCRLPFSVPVQPGAPPRKPGKEELDPYNISNDHHYEGMKHRVRQTFGSIIVQHSYPALKLQLPFVRDPPHTEVLPFDAYS